MAEPNQTSTRPEDHTTVGERAHKARRSPVTGETSEQEEGTSGQQPPDPLNSDQSGPELHRRPDGELTHSSLDQLWKRGHEDEPTFELVMRLVRELLHNGDCLVTVGGDRVTLARESRIVRELADMGSLKCVFRFVWGAALLRRSGELSPWIEPGDAITMKLAELTYETRPAFYAQARDRYDAEAQRRFRRRLHGGAPGERSDGQRTAGEVAESLVAALCSSEHEKTVEVA